MVLYGRGVVTFIKIGGCFPDCMRFFGSNFLIYFLDSSRLRNSCLISRLIISIELILGRDYFFPYWRYVWRGLGVVDLKLTANYSLSVSGLIIKAPLVYLENGENKCGLKVGRNDFTRILLAVSNLILDKDFPFLMDYNLGLLNRLSSSTYIFIRLGNYKLVYSCDLYICIESREDRISMLL
jgi:hypothetical protein